MHVSGVGGGVGRCDLCVLWHDVRVNYMLPVCGELALVARAGTAGLIVGVAPGAGGVGTDRDSDWRFGGRVLCRGC